MGNKNALERYLVIDYYLHYFSLTFDELVAKVNHRLRKDGLQQVSERTIRGDLYNMETIFKKDIQRVRWSEDGKVHYKYISFTKPIFTKNQ